MSNCAQPEGVCRILAVVFVATAKNRCNLIAGSAVVWGHTSHENFRPETDLHIRPESEVVRLRRIYA